MLEAKVVETIAAGVDKLWPILGNFRGVKAGGGIESVDFEGDGVGMTRHIHLANGTIVEQLATYDDAAHQFSYAIVNDDGPLPFADYSAVVKLTEDGNGVTTVEWTGSFNARGVSDEQAVQIATGIYKNGIEQARKAVS